MDDIVRPGASSGVLPEPGDANEPLAERREARASAASPGRVTTVTGLIRRLAVIFAVILVAVVGLTMLMMHQLSARRAAGEANQRLGMAANFSLAQITAERDRNRSDALELASRPSLQQAIASRDAVILNRQISGLRQTLRDDILIVFADDGTLLARDQVPDIEVDGSLALVRAALGGTPGAATLLLGPHLVIAAAVPVTVGNDTVGVIFVADTLDERFVRRMNTMTRLMVSLNLDNGSVIATEPLRGPPLSADQWTTLRSRGEMYLRVNGGDETLWAHARPLLGPDNRPVGALVVGMPEASITAIEWSDLPLLLALVAGILSVFGGLGGLALWMTSRWLTSRLVLAPAMAGGLPLDAGALPAPAPDDVRHAPGLVIDRGRRLVEVEGRLAPLTPTEFELLWALAAEPGRVVTRDALLEHLRGADWQSEPGVLDTHVSNLRRKIEPDPARPRYLLTVRGVGYKLPEPGP